MGDIFRFRLKVTSHQYGQITASLVKTARGGSHDVTAPKPSILERTMHRPKRARIADLNQHLTCKLCRGYFIDATTIIECLHSFCRSCIVKYLRTNKYCPVCDVQVHKSKPFLNIRPDKTLQDVVYKLVPRLLQNELQRRQEFKAAHPETKPSLDETTHETYQQHLFTPDESISLILSHHDSKKSARYLQCPSAVSVRHLQKLIRAKYDLCDEHYVEILYNQDCLNSSLTLMDIAYIYSWKRKEPMELTYRIYQQIENVGKKLSSSANDRAETHKDDFKSPSNNNNWKEVQLRISENGEMSITGIQDEEIVNNNNYKSDLVTVVETKMVNEELPDDNNKINTTTDNAANLVTATAISITMTAPVIVVTSNSSSSNSCVNASTTATTKTVYSTINSSKCSVTQENLKSDTLNKKDTENSDKTKTCNKNSDVKKVNHLDRPIKRKLDDNNEQPIKKEKQTILNHSIGVQNLSNNHPLKKHAQLNKTPTSQQETNITTTTTSATTNMNTTSSDNFQKPIIINTAATRSYPRPGTPKPPTTKPCYMPKPVINIPKPSTSSSVTPKQQSPNKMQTSQNLTIMNKVGGVKSKASTPIGYKTLRDPPKSWNSQIAKANINKPLPDPKYNDIKNVRPAKFFKMRNNLPRYLGNPASGVKPMYQVHVSPEKDKDNKNRDKDNNEKHDNSSSSSSSSSATIATTTNTSASNNSKSGEIKKHSIVKIDPKTLKPISEKAPETTSLSNATSDLKINTSQVSIFNPLKLQNSPKSERKSPKSPKSSSPTTKRDKLNLNFTPPNPFIPNLASPTVSPNQFLYSGPPGFPPPYDPRVMAAYHSLFYSQRMPFPAGLSLDLNQRKGFELTGPPSPKIGGLSQHSSQIQHKLPGSELHQQSSSRSGSNSSNSLGFKHQISKKSIKESSSKSEKSLQNAVEKLTQNRVKEIKNEAVLSNSTNNTRKSEDNKNKLDKNEIIIRTDEVKDLKKADDSITVTNDDNKEKSKESEKKPEPQLKTTEETKKSESGNNEKPE